MARDDKQAILKRRRFFIASAMAGFAAANCGPQTCLSPAVEPRTATPQVQPTTPEGETANDAGGDATDADANADGDAQPPLSAEDSGAAPPEPPPPQVCLSPPRHPDPPRPRKNRPGPCLLISNPWLDND